MPQCCVEFAPSTRLSCTPDGWFAYAVSAAHTLRGVFVFQVPESVVGVSLRVANQADANSRVSGLIANLEPIYPVALDLSRGTATVLVDGQPLPLTTSYTSDTFFYITVYDGFIYLSYSEEEISEFPEGNAPGTLLYATDTPIATTNAGFYVHAWLYARNDEVTSAAFYSWEPNENSARAEGVLRVSGGTRLVGVNGAHVCAQLCGLASVRNTARARGRLCLSGVANLTNLTISRAHMALRGAATSYRLETATAAGTACLVAHASDRDIAKALGTLPLSGLAVSLPNRFRRSVTTLECKAWMRGVASGSDYIPTGAATRLKLDGWAHGRSLGSTSGDGYANLVAKSQLWGQAHGQSATGAQAAGAAYSESKAQLIGYSTSREVTSTAFSGRAQAHGMFRSKGNGVGRALANTLFGGWGTLTGKGQLHIAASSQFCPNALSVGQITLRFDGTVVRDSVFSLVASDHSSMFGVGDARFLFGAEEELHVTSQTGVDTIRHANALDWLQSHEVPRWGFLSPFTDEALLSETWAFNITRYQAAMDRLVGLEQAITALTVTMQSDDALHTDETAPIALAPPASDTLQLTEVARTLSTHIAVDALNALEQTLPHLTVAMTPEDQLALADTARWIANLLGTDNLLLSEALNVAHNLMVADRLIGADTATARALVQQVLSDTLATTDTPVWLREWLGEDALTVGEVLALDLVARLTAIDTLLTHDAPGATLFVQSRDELSVLEAVQLALRVAVNGEDRALFTMRLPDDGAEYFVYAFNTETTGVSTYHGFAFNSFATHKGVSYGLNESGLFELTGEDDDGAPIAARIQTGDISFGTTRDKMIPRAYLYLTQHGDMILRTTVSKGGQRKEVWYELALRDATDDETLRRVQLARGLRGTAWQFALENVDGADFEIQGADVLPLTLNRRG